MDLIARLITILAVCMGFFMGAIVGHFEGQAAVYAKMLGSTDTMLHQLEQVKVK